MISSNVFLVFDTFDSEKDVLNFIRNEEIMSSNSKTWKKDINKLLNYKKEHLRKFSKENHYRNIYGYYLKIMIPYHMTDRVNEFVSETMKEIDRRFLRNLFVYKVIQQGKGRYAEIICFTRAVFKKPRKKVKKYHRDYYYDSKTKKICKKENSNAVLKCKKGDPILDKDGNKVYETAEVKATEERIFVYHTIQQLTERLKKAVTTVIEESEYHFYVAKIVSRITVNPDDNNDKRYKKMKRNREIGKINKIIHQFMDMIIQGKLVDQSEFDEYNHEVCEIADEMVYQNKSETGDVIEHLQQWWKKKFMAFI